MTPGELIAAFETLADASDGVKRLRELVLQLAVRGKLVHHEPDCEIDGVLVEANFSRMRRGSRPPTAPDLDPPFDLPPNWRWYHLGEVTHDWGTKEPDRPFTYIDVGSVDNNRWVIGDELSVVDAAAAPSRARRIVKRGSVIYSTVRPYLLNVAIVDRDFDPEPIVSTAFAVLHPGKGLDSRYLHLVLRSDYFIGYVSSTMKGVAYPAISDSQLIAAQVPIPPLAEQHRIVARVDELMGLLDRLEAARTARDEVRRATRDAVLAALRDAEDAEAVEAAWARISGQMDALFTDPEDVAPLRLVVLEMAARGRLVPQDVTENVVLLVERMREHRRRVESDPEFRARIVRDDKAGPRFHGVPESWESLPLHEIFRFIDYRGQTPPKTTSGVRLVTARHVKPGVLRREPEEYISATTYEQWMRRGFPKKGDLLFTTEAPLGHVAQLDEDGVALAQRIIALQPFADVNPRFMMFAMMSPSFGKLLLGEASGMTATGVKADRLKRLPLPVPPVSEQHRIVAKVDALMALCDQLEARLTAARELQTRFAAAAVHHLDV